MNYEDEIEPILEFTYEDNETIYDIPLAKHKDGKTFIWEYAHESCTKGSVFRRNMPYID